MLTWIIGAAIVIVLVAVAVIALSEIDNVKG
jgi:hypothetical protein